jgi:N4-gp56 family major capsid protein
MAISNFIPEIWSRNLNLAFRKAFVHAALVNQDYEGEIRDAGDTVRIMRPSAIAVANYTGTVTYADPTSTEAVLEIDQKKYWAFRVDDVDAVQANVNLVSAYTTEAGVAMADAVDQFIASHYTAAHADNIITAAAYTNLTIYNAFVEAGKRLNAKNVPQAGRVAMVSPHEYALLLNAPEFIKASDLGDAVVQSGALGMVAGFMIYLTNNAPTASSARQLLFGTPASTTFAAQLVKTEALRLPTQFGDGVRGLMVYGAKVIKPEALGVLRVTV